MDITEVSSFETVRSGMGLVPQGRRVFPTLSVEENLMVAERSLSRRGWNMPPETVSRRMRATGRFVGVLFLRWGLLLLEPDRPVLVALLAVLNPVKRSGVA